MEKLSSAAALIDKCRPERPVRGLRPHAAGRAARWFLEKFPGDVAYAYKANSSVFLLGALYGAGIRHFDVASIPEIEDAATIPDANLHFMHPVKSRNAIRRAFAEFGHGLGLLFQIADDILDVTGTAASLGKSPGKDVAAGKLTYPAVYGLEATRSRLTELAAELSRKAAGLEGAGGVLDGLVAYVARRDR